MKNRNSNYFTSVNLSMVIFIFISSNITNIGRGNKVLNESSLLPESTIPSIEGCEIFPQNNYWNTPVDTLPIHPLSSMWINSIGPGQGFHMDFGSGNWNGGPIGIPFNLATSSTPKYAVDFYYSSQSDGGLYPIPNNPLIEYGSDHHILSIDTEDCILYEIYDAWFENDSWHAGSGAIHPGSLTPTNRY